MLRADDGESSGQITQLLQRWRDGDSGALEALVPRVESRLLRLARAYLRRERAGASLETRGLVNEAYLRLLRDGEAIDWCDRTHFYRTTARIMRRVLVDRARKRDAAKRAARHVPLDEAAMQALPERADSVDLVELHAALERLETLDPRQAVVVELKFFGGLHNREIAEVMQLSLGTVKRDWRMARSWLYLELTSDGDP